MKDVAPKDLNNGFEINSSDAAMKRLLSKAELDSSTSTSTTSTSTSTSNSDSSSDSDSNASTKSRKLNYSSRIAKYSIQFQGCHTIKHWNKDAEDDDDIRVSTKRLVRFRLVPYNKCSAYNPWADTSAIQSAKALLGQADYGDYIVDMSTFVEAYLETKNEEGKYYGDDGGNGRNLYYNNANATDDANAYSNASFDIDDYTQCAAFEFNQNTDDAAAQYSYYLGPYCADQGGEIRLNLFTDDTCTTLAKCNNGAKRGANCYEAATGLTIPYTEESIVEDPCVPCSANYGYLATAPSKEIDSNTYDFGYARDACAGLYEVSGKCEKNMKNGKYDYGCTYMQGVQIGMSRDGYAIGVKRSLGADAALATMAIMVSFLGMYIYYLRYALKKVDSKHYKKDFYVSSRLG
jgi:hypothetical protein